MIPVSIVTGFLGSGKTTLISRLLREPAFSRTAVIVNEFGEIGLDNELIATSDDSLIELTTGCLCCAVQTDLAQTLLSLMDRRKAGSVVYDRVLIETSGLADPGPILQALMSDLHLAQHHEVASVTVIVDSVLGTDMLASHIEARRQVALADQMLVSKTDILPISTSLQHSLQSLNPAAPLNVTTAADAATLLAGSASGDALNERIAALKRAQSVSPEEPAHPLETEAILLTRDRPMQALVLTMLLQGLVEHCGARLLRMKGLVAIEEMPGQPAVIHGVRHVVSSPVFLDRWPGTDHSTRIVLIGTGIPRYFPDRLLDAIEAEVREATDAAAF